MIQTYKRFKLTIILLFLLGLSSFAQVRQSELTIQLLENENWWGAVVADGYLMPIDNAIKYNFNLLGDNKMNQIQPFLLSNKGRYIWSEEPFAFAFENGKLKISENLGKVELSETGKTLKDAYLAASQKYFPSTGKIPAELFFTHPQYNTWIELTYNHNQKDILIYANSLIENGFPKGVFMIDDTWQTDYGVWEFNPAKFSDPKAMMDQLKQMGFRTILWVCPMVSPDSPEFRAGEKKGLFIKNSNDGSPAIIRWWNGYSAFLDMTNPGTVEYFRSVLNGLMDKYGVDGFKLDGGDAPYYVGDYSFYKKVTSNEQTYAWANFSKDFKYNELRVGWKNGGQEIVQRLHDKSHSWEALETLIPNMINLGLIGNAYSCPDMIGGGEFGSFLNLEKVDQELIVRSAQVHALMPMMQFSVAPWRVLSKENMEICADMARLHVKYGETILALAKESAKTGEPILRNMEYVFPNKGYERIIDQFMIGNDILVAPVIKKDARSRQVVFPEGNWKGDDGTIIKGGKTVKIDAPLSRLPYFERI